MDIFRYMRVTLEMKRIRFRFRSSHDRARDLSALCTVLRIRSLAKVLTERLFSEDPSLGSGSISEHMANPGGQLGRGATYRVVLLGELGVGKTSLFRRIKDNTFDQQQPATSGIDSCSKYITVDGEEIVVSGSDGLGWRRGDHSNRGMIERVKPRAQSYRLLCSRNCWAMPWQGRGGEIPRGDKVGKA